MEALRTAATGMAAQQMNVEVISNNIANMNTVAFKRQRACLPRRLSVQGGAAAQHPQESGTPVDFAANGGVVDGREAHPCGPGFLRRQGVAHPHLRVGVKTVQTARLVSNWTVPQP